jgi:hypothetical protein
MPRYYGKNEKRKYNREGRKEGRNMKMRLDTTTIKWKNT